MVRRVCFVHLKNHHDTEDVFQEVFLKYALRDAPFEGEAHEKAWLIRVAINACKDTLKSFFRKKSVPLDDMGEEPTFLDEGERDVIDAVLRLPANYKNAVYLFYYEGFSALEIAAMLGKSPNTVYTWLARARARLRDELGGDGFG